MLFTPGTTFSLDAEALGENCFCPISRVASSEIKPSCASLTLVSGKKPALVEIPACAHRVPVFEPQFYRQFGQWWVHSRWGPHRFNGLSDSPRQCSGGGAQSRVFLRIIRLETKSNAWRSNLQVLVAQDVGPDLSLAAVAVSVVRGEDQPTELHCAG